MGLPRPVLQRVYRGADGRSDVVAKVYSDMSVSGVGKLGWHAVMSNRAWRNRQVYTELYVVWEHSCSGRWRPCGQPLYVCMALTASR